MESCLQGNGFYLEIYLGHACIFLFKEHVVVFLEELRGLREGAYVRINTVISLCEILNF